MSDDMRNLWQAQGSGAAPLTLEELRAKAVKFSTRIARRNLREYMGAVVVVLWFGYGVWAAPTRCSCASGTGWWSPALFTWHSNCVGGPPHRRHRECWRGKAAWSSIGRNWCGQRDALSSVWKWYIGPLVPGLAVLMAPGCV